MRRLLITGLVVATAAVGYAAAGGFGGDGPLGRWHRDRQLPSLRGRELPFRYPAHLWREGVEGEVVLRIHITETGAVDSVELERSSGYAELDRVALTGARRLSYHPALEDDRPVAVWATVPVRFQRRRGVGETQERGE